MHGPVNENRKLTEKIDCAGTETSLEKCAIQYSSSSGRFSRGKTCKLSEEIVSITCVTDSLASCPPGEVPWGGSCYSLHFNRSSFVEAQGICKSEGKFLAEITSQEENDLLSELILQNEFSPGLLADLWTGAVGGGTQRSRRLYWHGSRQNVGSKINDRIKEKSTIFNEFHFSVPALVARMEWRKKRTFGRRLEYETKCCRGQTESKV